MSSFEELNAKAAEARNKIVVYNAPFVTYGQTVQYRSRGAAGMFRYDIRNLFCN